MSDYRRPLRGIALCATALAASYISGAAACPVATEDGEHSLHGLDTFSPVTTVKLGGPAPLAQKRAQGIACEGGFADVYPCNNVDLLSFVPLSDLGGGSGNDIWGWTDPDSGREYALFGRTSGTSFVDVTDPGNPVYLGNLPTHSGSSSWRDIKVYDNHAYVVSEASNHGMQVFDLTQLRDVTNPPVQFTETAHYAGFSRAHNIVVNEDSGFAFATGTSSSDGCAGGLHMIDIQTPDNPQFAGCYSGDGYTHDAQCVIYDGPDHRFHHGNEICFNSNEDTLTVVDVSDKSSPQTLARVPYAGSAYTHQGWLSEDQRYFFLDDEGDETRNGHPTRTYIWDISELDNPQLVNQFDSRAAAIDHNIYVKGAYAFQANYRAGLRILDISNVANGVVKENGYFDIYPSDDQPNFNGAWSNYPYFPSGNVVVSGIEQGLFVLRPTALQPAFTVDAPAEPLAVCGSGSSSIPVTVNTDGFYQGTLTLSVSGLPAGAQATLSPATITPPATTTLTVDAGSAPPGQHLLDVTASDGALSFSTSVMFEFSTAPPGVSDPLLPEPGSTAVSSVQTLYWTPASLAFRYDVEIAADPSFTEPTSAIDDSALTMFSPGALPPETTSYWRVTAGNACGDTRSDTWSFTTAAQSCSVAVAKDLPRVISTSGTPTIVSTLTSSAGGRVMDVDVLGLRGQHSWFNDLDFRLEGPLNDNHAGRGNRHPARVLVQIMAQSCDSENDFDLSLDDEAPAGPWPCPPVGGGTYQPTDALAAFDGASGDGDWQLIVNDNVNQDGGSLDGWGISVCTTPEPALLDIDSDGVPDEQDNCTDVFNPDQRDTHGDGYGNLCDPDLNNDGIVNFLDLGLMKGAFFGDDPDADLDGDGQINFSDLGILKAKMFAPPGPSGIAVQ